MVTNNDVTLLTRQRDRSRLIAEIRDYRQKQYAGKTREFKRGEKERAEL
jgi:hypothetical protein